MTRSDLIAEVTRRAQRLLMDAPIPKHGGVTTLRIDGITINEIGGSIWIGVIAPPSPDGMETHDVVFSDRIDGKARINWTILENTVLPALQKATVLDDLAST